MAKDNALSFHPAAAIFPLLQGDALQELVDSIRSHGLLEPIKTHDGKIIDGRNRLTACRMAGVDPRFEAANVNGSPAAYVYAMNYSRRHLSPGARMLAAGRFKEACAKEAKERQKRKPQSVVASSPPQKGKARDAAAELFAVGGKSVDAAEKILKQGAPEVIAAVEAGTLPVATAAHLTAAPKSVQAAAVKEGRSAIRDAIKQHSPSVNEEARNDPGVKWVKSMREIRSRLVSTRELGGIKELTARWTAAQITEYRDDIQEVIKELQVWEIALTTKLRKSSTE